MRLNRNQQSLLAAVAWMEGGDSLPLHSDPAPELGLLDVGWGEARAAQAWRCIIQTSPSQDWLLS